MTTQDNKALVRRYREAHNANNLALLDEIVSTDIKSHSSIPGFPPGLEGGKKAHQTFLAAFPDGHVITEDMITKAQTPVHSWVCPPRARK